MVPPPLTSRAPSARVARNSGFASDPEVDMFVRTYVWRCFLVLAATMTGPLSAQAAEGAAFNLREPWSAEYAGQDAAGEHVIGLWQFNGGARRPMPPATGTPPRWKTRSSRVRAVRQLPGVFPRLAGRGSTTSRVGEE